MATELIKGYGRARISPRCVLKVDLKKAYDSLDLQTVLEDPRLFVKWVMACISTVSYSIMFNGCTTLSRLRRG